MTEAGGLRDHRRMKEIEIALIERLRHRDPGALADLYDLFGRLTYSLVVRMVRDPGIAEDLVQETFLRVWTRIHTFDTTSGALGSWLLAIARHCSVDYLRCAGGRGCIQGARLDQIEDPKVFVDAEGAILFVAERERVHQALDKLRNNQRTAIELAYFEGLTQTEMATKLGYPLGTVKGWVRSALRILRDELQQSSAPETSCTDIDHSSFGRLKPSAPSVRVSAVSDTGTLAADALIETTLALGTSKNGRAVPELGGNE